MNEDSYGNKEVAGREVERNRQYDNSNNKRRKRGNSVPRASSIMRYVRYRIT